MLRVREMEMGGDGKWARREEEAEWGSTSALCSACTVHTHWEVQYAAVGCGRSL